MYLAQVSKYLQTLVLGLIIFMLRLPKTLHGCTVYIGLGSGTEKININVLHRTEIDSINFIGQNAWEVMDRMDFISYNAKNNA